MLGSLFSSMQTTPVGAQPALAPQPGTHPVPDTATSPATRGQTGPDKPRGITPEPRNLPPNGPVISDLGETRFRADMLRQALAQEVAIDMPTTPLPQPGLLPPEMRPAQADPADNGYRANVRALTPDSRV